MKAVLEFNLPEDQTNFEFASEGSKWWSIIWDMDQWLRSQIKYTPDGITDDELEAFEECRAKLRELIDDYNLNLDK
jgi:hypothetical protein